MPNSTERPFGHHTLKISATFVPEGAEDTVSRADIKAAVGSRPVEIDAVFVPEGGEKPGHPFVAVGDFEFRPDDDEHAISDLDGQAPAPVRGAYQGADEPEAPRSASAGISPVSSGIGRARRNFE